MTELHQTFLFKMVAEIYVQIDDIIKENREEVIRAMRHLDLIGRDYPTKLSLSEVMTLLIYYHHSGYKCFKSYYNDCVLYDLRRDFPDVVSYSHFVNLIPRALVGLMFALAHQMKQSKSTGIYYGDSYPIPACHPKRVHQHKVMRGFADWGKTSVGWFYGLKCHVVINHLGELMSCTISSGSVADNDAGLLFRLTKELLGYFFGDKGYMLNEDKRNFLERDGELKFVTKVRKNMKKQNLELEPKLWLKKRGVVESVIDIHKRHLEVAHTRHRSASHAFVNIFAGLVAYNFLQRKPSTKICIERYLLRQAEKPLAIAA